MARILTLKKFDEMKQSVKNQQRLVESFNSHHCVTGKTNIIIVGTITPPEGVKNGYFYTAPFNKIYGYIEEARNVSLKKQKELLKNATDGEKRKIVDDIKKILEGQGIAFLDVMGSAIRKEGKETSCADSDIQYCTLAKKDFEQAFNRIPESNKVRVICNSKEAQRKYQKLRESLSILPEEQFLSQRRGTKEKWIWALK